MTQRQPSEADLETATWLLRDGTRSMWVHDVAAALAAERLRERERCAKIAEAHDDGIHVGHLRGLDLTNCGVEIAAAIRSEK